MLKMELIVNDFSDYSDIFSLWSIVYVKIGDFCFPDDQWWDSTSDILYMWIEGIYRLVSGCTDCCVLDFMDGDFAIKLTSKNQCEAAAICTRPYGTVAFNGNVDLLHFARQLLSAVEKMKMQYTDYYDSRVIQRLITEANKLRTIIKMRR